jgi:hypothetical protein
VIKSSYPIVTHTLEIMARIIGGRDKLKCDGVLELPTQTTSILKYTVFLTYSMEVNTDLFEYSTSDASTISLCVKRGKFTLWPSEVGRPMASCLMTSPCDLQHEL